MFKRISHSFNIDAGRAGMKLLALCSILMITACGAMPGGYHDTGDTPISTPPKTGAWADVPAVNPMQNSLERQQWEFALDNLVRQFERELGQYDLSGTVYLEPLEVSTPLVQTMDYYLRAELIERGYRISLSPQNSHILRYNITEPDYLGGHDLRESTTLDMIANRSYQYVDQASRVPVFLASLSYRRADRIFAQAAAFYSIDTQERY